MKCGYRTTVAGLCIALLATSCTEAPSGSDKETVARYLDALLVERDWDRWPEFFAAEASVNGTPFALQVMRGTAEGLHYSFPDLSVEVREQVEEPGRVATLFVLHGTHERAFDAQPPTYLPIALDGFVVDHFRDGRIVESTMILDVWGLSRRVAAASRPE